MTQALRAIWPSYDNIANHLPHSAGCESLAPRLRRPLLTRYAPLQSPPRICSVSSSCEASSEPSERPQLTSSPYSSVVQLPFFFIGPNKLRWFFMAKCELQLVRKTTVR
jgi:hypothetical protein